MTNLFYVIMSHLSIYNILVMQGVDTVRTVQAVNYISDKSVGDCANVRQ